MVLRSKKVAMIMVMGLLVAGLVGRLPHVAADTSIDQAEAALKRAQAAQASAQKMLTTMMAHMDSMKNMQMSSTEKAMYDGMHDMAMTVKMLMDANRMLMEAVRDLLAITKEKKG